MFFFVEKKEGEEGSEKGTSGDASVQATGSNTRSTISAIFSAGVLQNSVGGEVFFGVLVPTFPRRWELTALASLWFTAASSAVVWG